MSKALCIINFYKTPPIPLNYEKPSKGTLDVPVTNWIKPAFSYLSKLSKISQKYLIIWEF